LKKFLFIIFFVSFLILNNFIIIQSYHTLNAKNLSKKYVLISVDNKSIAFYTTKKYVHQAIKEVGINLNFRDRVYPKLTTLLKEKNFIKIVRVNVRIFFVSEKIPPPTKLISSDKYRSKKIIKKGKEGILKKKLLIFYKDGEKTLEKVLYKKVVKKPTPQIIALGLKQMLSSRGYYTRKVLTMVATAYEPYGCLGCSGKGITATGIKAGYGVVAVDPRVIPLGTKLYIPGYGFALAADTGGAIKGKRIDLGFNTKKEVYKFGKRKIKVYILGK
jgi:3D (Asp-Asp-Asp) domain-containing protein